MVFRGKKDSPLLPLSKAWGWRSRVLPASEQGRRGFGSKDGAPLSSGNSVAEGGEVEGRTPDEDAKAWPDSNGWRQRVRK